MGTCRLVVLELCTADSAVSDDGLCEVSMCE